MTTQILNNLVPAFPLSSLNFMFTEKCNLKCVYCPQYSVTSSNGHIDASLLDYIIEYILTNSIKSAGIGFYGETLCFEGWEQYARKLIDAGIGMSICSNWNHKLTDNEVRVLSRFNFMQFSIDTANADLLRTIRPPADFKNILYNMHLIRSKVILDNLPHPVFMWCSVLSNKIVPYLSDLVAMAVSNGVKHINFNELEYYEESSHELKSIFDLENDEFVFAVNEIEKMDLLAKKYGVEITYAFNSFLDVIRARKIQYLTSLEKLNPNNPSDVFRIPVKGIQGLSNHIALQSTTILPNEKKGRTRLCLAPWSTAYILSDGTVCTCCVRGEHMGKITPETNLDDILNSNKYREIRWRLLTGEITDNACLACPVAPIVSVEQLEFTVTNLLKNNRLP